MNTYKTRLAMFIVGFLESILLWLTCADGIQFYYSRSSADRAIKRLGYMPLKVQANKGYIPDWDEL